MITRGQVQAHKGQRKDDLELRVETRKIDTLEAKSLELAIKFKKYRIHVACVQETRWKGQKAIVVNGYKLWYAGLDEIHSRAGILVAK